MVGVAPRVHRRLAFGRELRTMQVASRTGTYLEGGAQKKGVTHPENVSGIEMIMIIETEKFVFQILS